MCHYLHGDSEWGKGETYVSEAPVNSNFVSLPPSETPTEEPRGSSQGRDLLFLLWEVEVSSLL